MTDLIRDVIAEARKRAVFVEWIDSTGRGRWTDAEWTEENLVCDSVFSIGYVLRDDENEIVIVQSLAPDVGDVMHALAIPHVAVVGIWEIKDA